MVGTGGRYCGLVTQSYSCSFFSKSEKLKYNVPASFTATGGHGTQHLTVKYKSTSSERPPCFLASAVPLLFPVLSLNTPRRCWGQQPSWEHKDKGHVLGIATEEEMPWDCLSYCSTAVLKHHGQGQLQKEACSWQCQRMRS